MCREGALHTLQTQNHVKIPTYIHDPQQLRKRSQRPQQQGGRSSKTRAGGDGGSGDGRGGAAGAGLGERTAGRAQMAI